MRTPDVPLDKAELLSVLLEALLYGFSLLMFGATIWTLLSHRSTDQVNTRTFTVACALLLCSTAHIVVHIIRAMDGLIRYRDTFSGGPAAYFGDISQWTFNAKNCIYTVQMLIGDGVILYRCYIVWQSKLVVILPAMLWCAAGVTGFMSCYTSSIATQSGVFGGVVSRWITSFWATSLTANLMTTLLLACRLWYVDRNTTRLRGPQQSQLRPVLHTIIDAGAIYTLTLLVALVCFASQSNVQYVVLDMVTPIISITFYMVIIRVGLATCGNRSMGLPRGNTTDFSPSTERRRRMQVHVTMLTESKLEYRSPVGPMASTASGSNPSEIKLDSGGGDHV